MVHAPTSSSDRPQLAPRPAFTLVELLVVLAVIGLALVIAVPAFTSITEGRKESASQNLISAALSRARAEAIKLGQPAGVMFFYDAATQRSRMVIVKLAIDPTELSPEFELTDPSPYLEYNAYLDGAAYDYQGSNFDPLPDVAGEPPMTADRVIGFAIDENFTPGGNVPAYDNLLGQNFANIFGRGRPAVVTWRRTTGTVDTPTGGGPPPGTTDLGTVADLQGTNPGLMDTVGNLAAVATGAGTADDRFAVNAGWEADQRAETQRLDLIPVIDIIEIPAGINAQVITGVGLDGDEEVAGAIDAGGFFRERYVTTGAILFDAQGNLLSTDYVVVAGTSLGQLLGLNGPSVVDDQVTLPIFFARTTGVGLVVFDAESFNSAQSDGTALRWTRGGTGALAATRATSEVEGVPITQFTTTIDDFRVLPVPTPAAPYVTPNVPNVNDDAEQTGEFPANTPGAFYGFNEYAEERWLDANTTPLLVNRSSGQLSLSE
ncbi:MAG: prepilin-type N-terminal cleavage/methylation domain-containing protein [Planctomycetota bacterium]